MPKIGFLFAELLAELPDHEKVAQNTKKD